MANSVKFREMLKVPPKTPLSRSELERQLDEELSLNLQPYNERRAALQEAREREHVIQDTLLEDLQAGGAAASVRKEMQMERGREVQLTRDAREAPVASTLPGPNDAQLYRDYAVPARPASEAQSAPAYSTQRYKVIRVRIF